MFLYNPRFLPLDFRAHIISFNFLTSRVQLSPKIPVCFLYAFARSEGEFLLIIYVSFHRCGPKYKFLSDKFVRRIIHKMRRPEKKSWQENVSFALASSLTMEIFLILSVSSWDIPKGILKKLKKI